MELGLVLRVEINKMRFSAKIDLEYKKSFDLEYDSYITGLNNLKDFSMTDMSLYGKVDRNYSTLVVKNDRSIFQNVGGSVRVLDFVADAYRDLIGHIFETKSKAGVRMPAEYISEDGTSKSSFIFNMTPSIGLIEPRQQYSNDLDVLFDFYINDFLRHKDTYKAIKNHKDFVKNFVNFSLSNSFPDGFCLTMSGYMKRKRVPYFCTGLAIKINNDEPQQANLYEKYLKDPNYRFFANAAKKYGFLINKNRPTTIIANLASSKMQEYMSGRGTFYGSNPDAATKNGISSPGGLGHHHKYVVNEHGDGYTVDVSHGPAHVHQIRNWEVMMAGPEIKHAHHLEVSDVFGKYFNRTFNNEIESLRKQIYFMYKTYAELNSYVDSYGLDASGELVPAPFYRKKIDNVAFNNTYPGKFWLTYYMDLRISEEKVFMEKQKYQKIYKMALKKFAEGGLTLAADYINEQLAKRKYFMSTGPNVGNQLRQTGQSHHEVLAQYFS